MHSVEFEVTAIENYYSHHASLSVSLETFASVAPFLDETDMIGGKPRRLQSD